MAKQIIPEELETLLQEYLTDGVITPKERQVLLRKAEKLGVDIDEFDLYIDAQEQKVQQAADSASKKLKGQSCPFCGGSVPQLADKCPHCGQNITVEASSELTEIIENLENALVEIKDSNNFERNKALTERYMRKAKLYYSNNPKVKLLLEEVNAEMETAEKKYKAQNTWIKKHSYMASFFGLILIALFIGAFVQMEDDHQFLISFVLVGLGGIIIFIKYIIAANKKEQERLDRLAAEERARESRKQK